MKNPARWKHPDGGAPLEVRELLQVAQPSRLMSDAELARSAEQVAQIAAMPVGLSAAVIVKKILSAFLSIIAAGVLIAGGSMVAPNVQSTPIVPSMEPPMAVHTAAPVEAEPPPVNVEPAPGLPVLDRHGTNHEPAHAVAPLQRPKKQNPKHDANAASEKPRNQAADDSLSAEVGLIKEARPLVATNPRSALDWLDEHARAFPNGQLSIERELLAIDALVALGRQKEGRQRGEALLKRVHGGPDEAQLRAKLDAVLGLQE